MHFPLYSTAAIVLTLASLPIDAQQVTLRGKVDDVSGTQNQFVVDCTNVSISSGVFNLNLFIGQQVELTGLWNGSFAAPAISVTNLATVARSFEIGGGGKIGKLNNLSVTGPVGNVAVAYISTGAGFAPLEGIGTVLLDPARTILIGVGSIPPFGTRKFPLPIPNDQSLIGFELHGQGVIVDTANGLVQLTNPDCKTLKD